MFRAIIKEYPADPWGYIALGDMLHGAWVARGAADGFKSDDKKAEELYRMALGLDPDEDKIIQDRLRDLKVVGLLKPLKGQ